MSTFNDMRAVLADGEIKRVIELLKENIKNGDIRSMNDINLLSSRFKTNEKHNNIHGTIDKHHYSLEHNQIVKGLLLLINDLEEAEKQRLAVLEEERKKEVTLKEQQRLAILEEEKKKEVTVKEQDEDLKEATAYPSKNEIKNSRPQFIAWAAALVLFTTVVYMIFTHFFNSVNAITPTNIPKYDYYGDSYWQNRKIVAKNTLYGFIDSDSNEIVKPEYQYVHSFNEGRAAVKYNGLWGFVDLAGKEVVKPYFDSVKLFTNGRAAVLKNNLWGFIGLDNLMVISPQYLNVHPFVNGYSLVQNSKGFWGIIDLTGVITVKQEFDEIVNFISAGGKYPCNKNFPEIFVVKKQEYCYLINNKSQTISKGYSCIEPLLDCKNNLILVWNEYPDTTGNQSTGYGLINLDGKEIIQPKYDRIITPTNDSQNFRAGINCALNSHLPSNPYSTPKNDVEYFYTFLPSVRKTEELYRTKESIIIEQDNKFGFYDLNGILISPPKFIDVFDFQNGLARVREGFYWKIIDLQCRYITQSNFDEIKIFSEGLAAVRRDSLWGYIDTRGREVIKVKYLGAENFVNGIARVDISKENASDKLKIEHNQYIESITIHNQLIPSKTPGKPIKPSFAVAKGSISYYMDKKEQFIEF